MKHKFEKSVSGLIIVSLPVLLVVGCAANNQHLEQAEAGAKSLDTQFNPVPRQAGIAVKEVHDLHQGEAADEILQHDADLETGVAGERGVEQSLSQPALSAVAARESLAADTEHTVKAPTPPPQKRYFYFGFNQEEITAEDHDVIKQHAAYLLQHPQYILEITGHADNRGPKGYNQRLSEARAQKIAQLMLAEGVPQIQIRVSAMGDKVPMIDPARHHQNRRVELTYEDSVMAVRE